MQFIVKPPGTYLRNGLYKNTVLLTTDKWDDYGHKTSFHCYYYDNTGTVKTIGDVKIMKLDEEITTLPDSFEYLGDEYCSLGQSLTYYQEWFSLGSELARNVCSALRDINLMPSGKSLFTTTNAFKNSLIRFSHAEKAFHEAEHLFWSDTHDSDGKTEITKDKFAFQFTCRLDGFSQPHMINFNYAEPGNLPHRIVTLVGKNGTGKSGILCKLALALSGWERSAGEFVPSRPSFSITVAISYSIAQPFQIPIRDSFSYRYCGLRDGKGTIQSGAIEARIDNGLQQIFKRQRAAYWRQQMLLEDLLPLNLKDIVFSQDDRTLRRYQEYMKHIIPTLSSGQRIMISIITDMIAYVDLQSLILLDEPELYLHPTLLATLMRKINAILEEFDSYALIATHSPIVIQETPAKFVRVIERQGSVPYILELPMESLGANLTELVDIVFRVNTDDKNYRTIFDHILMKSSQKGIQALFEFPLSLNAQLYISSKKAP